MCHAIIFCLLVFSKSVLLHRLVPIWFWYSARKYGAVVMFNVLPVWVSGVSGSRVGRVVGDVITGGRLTSGGCVSIQGQGATVGHVMTGGQVTSGGRVSIEGQGATVGHVMTGGQVMSGVRVSGSHGGQVTVGAVGASKETKIATI